MISDHLSKIPYFEVLHIVIGSFDGIHRAHQQLIEYTVNTAKKNQEKSMIFSFDPLPKEYFNTKNFSGTLLPIEQKRKILENFGADYTVITKFESVKDFSEREFIDLLLQKAKKIILYSGSDFRIGCKKGKLYEGNDIKKVIIDDIYINNYLCRSSTIRELLLKGNITAANILLNREYTIYSKTTPGDQIGRTLDFPTINIVPNKQIIPENGVYFGAITIFQKIYPAAIYIGYRPTVNGKDLRIESHIIYDFPYQEINSGTDASVSFFEKISDEKSFDSLEELKKMLYNYKEISLGLATEKYKNNMNRLS